MRYDAVIFDLDGTLTRSEEGIFSSARHAFEEMGLQAPSEDMLKRFIGPPFLYSLEKIVGLPHEVAVRVQRCYRERYDSTGLFENELYIGIPALLRALKKRGIRLAIATGKPQKPAEAILKHFGLSRYFDAIIGTSGAGTEEKKDLIADALRGVQAKKPVMVGDREYDILGARAANIDSIGVGYGYGSEAELRGAGCTHYAKDVAALTVLLLEGEAIERGIFLTVEGGDGSGKTTQINALEKNLRRFGYDVLRTREPGGCPISEKIRGLILDKENADMSDVTEALLYAASRAQHVSQVIRPAVNAGKLVLCDRFVDSSITYQGGGRGLGIDTVVEINKHAVGDMHPNVTVYLDINQKAAMARRVKASDPDRIESAGDAFHERVDAAYRELVKRTPERFVTVDASSEIESVAKDCFDKTIHRIWEIENA